jgi:PucR C-terminal helix-turn-helix domain
VFLPLPSLPSSSRTAHNRSPTRPRSPISAAGTTPPSIDFTGNRRISISRTSQRYRPGPDNAACTKPATQHLDIAGVHPGLERLLRDDANQVLLETLEAYLDLAGNARATADKLRLHRTTLYYRLQRVEQLAETDLKDGSERLCLHLALKLGRLTGHYQPGR